MKLIYKSINQIFAHSEQKINKSSGLGWWRRNRRGAEKARQVDAEGWLGRDLACASMGQDFRNPETKVDTWEHRHLCHHHLIALRVGRPQGFSWTFGPEQNFVWGAHMERAAFWNVPNAQEETEGLPQVFLVFEVAPPWNLTENQVGAQTHTIIETIKSQGNPSCPAHRLALRNTRCHRGRLHIPPDKRALPQNGCMQGCIHTSNKTEWGQDLADVRTI